MVKREIIEKFSDLITAAFGLVAALAWNSAVQSIFAKYALEEGIIPKLIYAISVTILAVLATLAIGLFANKYRFSKNSPK